MATRTDTTPLADKVDTDTKAEAKPYAPGVGEFIAQRDADGTVLRVGVIVGEGRTPNLEHRNSEGVTKPESREPLVAWLVLAGAPSPFGGELHPLSS